VRLGVALQSKGLMNVVIAEMLPRYGIIGGNNGKGPSQLDETKRNILDATQVLEAVASRLVEALVNVRGEGTLSGGKGCSFKEFYEHPFPMFKGNLNSREARDWLTNLEELLRVIDYTEEKSVKYAAYKFSGEARQWWYAKRNSLVMELGSEEAIRWTQFKEEFYQEYSWTLRRSTSRDLSSNKKQNCWCCRCGRLHFGKCKSRKNLCYGCGKVGHFIQNYNQAKRNGTSRPGRK
jgi:hypothetical protein